MPPSLPRSCGTLIKGWEKEQGIIELEANNSGDTQVVQKKARNEARASNRGVESRHQKADWAGRYESVRAGTLM